MSREKLNRLVLAALFAAITCLATMVIRVPSLGGNGYVNVGDTAVLLSAWVLGGPAGFFAAGLGSGLADLLAGYAAYVPGTFVIKFVMAATAYAIFFVLKKVNVNRFMAYVISAVFAEIVMVAGYFVFEAFVLGYGYGGAAPAIISNIFQGISNLILGVTLVQLLDKGRVLKHVPGNTL